MQGKKHYQEKLFTHFQLSDRIPESNFYRRLHQALDLQFLYVLTKEYYGSCGQKSIDPVVFFKMSLVGYLENIISDRKLVEFCGMRLDVLYFLGYDIDEALPWHSTISRTRQLLPENVFNAIFDKVLGLCISKKNGRRTYPSHRQCFCKGQCKYGQFGIESASRKSVGTLGKSTSIE